jgi:hypothetical protein
VCAVYAYVCEIVVVLELAQGFACLDVVHVGRAVP